MILSFLLAAPAATSAVQSASLDVPESEIVVTASLTPVQEEEAPATVTTIDQSRIEALGEPLVADLLRRVPGVSVASAGPPGTQTQVRIRGAEANHTLLLIDGIRFNDPAAGNEPRFELLTTEGLARVEVVRGPQSALYGAEAIGGVVALFTGRQAPGAGASALLEAGSHDYVRASASAGSSNDARSLNVYGGYQRSSGIDSFGQGGERDGYDNLTFGGTAGLQLSSAVALGLSARYTDGTSEFDGFNPATFRRGNTLDETRNRIGAMRLSATIAPVESAWSFKLGGTVLGSSNRNRRAETPLNRTSGERYVLDALVSRELVTGSIRHQFSIAGDYEDERFQAKDQAFSGRTNQNRDRDRGAVVGEWRATFADRITTDLALRHDSFEGFADATTVRGSALVEIVEPLALFAGYGEGIARPTFFELFGFFPGRFRGNPDLKPERSRGYELGLRYRSGAVRAAITGYRQRLTDEIISTFDRATFLSGVDNAAGTSRRKGVEVETEWRARSNVTLWANYNYLDAEEQQVRGGAALREVRRPRHSGSAGIAGQWLRFSGGASADYVGKRTDLDFDAFPARRVTLDDYVLVNARAAYRLTDMVEAFGRVSNLFDADYEDVIGFETLGRTIAAGIRVRFGQ
ncbi:MAG: TonB-dependent receptor [Pseudomonadota bacterium]|nr:TonB-dependent receptor [Pseudomonadota bacterium]